jgi:hypothetical protein
VHPQASPIELIRGCKSRLDKACPSRIYLSDKSVNDWWNACPSADVGERSELAWTSATDSDDSGVTSFSSPSTSTTRHLPCLRSRTVGRLEVLQSMRDQAPMPYLQRSIPGKELLSQLRRSLEVIKVPKLRGMILANSLIFRAWARFLRICRILVLRRSSAPPSPIGRYGCSVDNPGRNVS